MLTYVRGLALSSALVLTMGAAYATPPTVQKSAPGSLVIVFKDGHRQTFSLSDIERVEFPVAEANASPSAGGPSRGHFLGKWEVGDGNGGEFQITLHEDGDAVRTLGNVRGKWVYLNGEAQITWNDGAQDAIRKVGGRYQKFAYKVGKAFTDVPDNVTSARNTMPSPI